MGCRPAMGGLWGWGSMEGGIWNWRLAISTGCRSIEGRGSNPHFDWAREFVDRMAEVAISKNLFTEILIRLDRLLGHLEELHGCSSKGLCSPPGEAPRGRVQRPQEEPRQQSGRVLGIPETQAGDQGWDPERNIPFLPGRICVAL